MLDIIITGVILGLLYSLVSLGLTLIYGISGIVNLMHGGFFVLGAYFYGIFLSYLLSLAPQTHLVVAQISAIILSCLSVAIIGIVFYRITLHQILGNEVSILIASMCACLAIHNLIYAINSEMALSFGIRLLIPGTVKLMNVVVPTANLVAAVVSIAGFTILSLFILKTNVGKAMKALSQDLEAAMLMGISLERIYIIASGLSAGLAGLGGIMYTSVITMGVSAAMWLLGLSWSFAAVVLGGLGSIKGSLLGGIILGVVFVSVMKTIPAAGVLQNSVPFIVIILMLMIRPKGIFGKRVEME